MNLCLIGKINTTEYLIAKQEFISLVENETNYYTGVDRTYDANGYNIDIIENPDSLNFWFDFLDTPGELSQFSVKAIGARTKAVKDTNVKSIYYRDVPNIIFRKPDEILDTSILTSAYRTI